MWGEGALPGGGRPHFTPIGDRPARIHQVTLRYSEIHSASFRCARALSDLPRFVQSHSHSLSLFPIHHNLFRLTKSPSDPPSLAWIHSDSHELTQIPLVSLRLTQPHSDPHNFNADQFRISDPLRFTPSRSDSLDSPRFAQIG